MSEQPQLERLLELYGQFCSVGMNDKSHEEFTQIKQQIEKKIAFYDSLDMEYIKSRKHYAKLDQQIARITEILENNSNPDSEDAVRIISEIGEALELNT